MEVVIQVAAEDSAKAWAFLVRHSPGTALPNRTFIVSAQAARTMREAGVRFSEISRNGISPESAEAFSGERI
jgi:hypothetical protein